MRQSLILVIQTLASIAMVAAFFTTTALSQLPIRFTVDGDSAGDRLGFSVSGAGDVNGDGFDDIIVSAPLDDNNGPDSGSARVYSGFDGAILYTFNGDSADDQLGFSVSGAGDVDDDGFDDIIVGAVGDDNNGSFSGSARVYSGFDGTILYTFNGDSADDQLGFSVSGAGDVNGDGFDDLIAGAWLDDNNAFSSGSARVYSGFDGAILCTFNGDSGGDLLGVSVSGAGDVNGDGFDDLIAGAWLDDNTGASSGSARVFSVCGQQLYGSGIDPAQTLTFEWRSFSGGLNAANGELIADGSAPFSPGVFALSTQPSMASLLGFTLLVDIAPSNALILENFSYDAAGQLVVPLSLRQPVLAGLTLFLQVVEGNPAAPMGLFSSNGLELLFCN
ncbi:MAG: integrin alpha [Planctomycetota bacterium]